jgi:hypothetical protein
VALSPSLKLHIARMAEARAAQAVSVGETAARALAEKTDREMMAAVTAEEMAAARRILDAQPVPMHGRMVANESGVVANGAPLVANVVANKGSVVANKGSVVANKGSVVANVVANKGSVVAHRTADRHADKEARRVYQRDLMRRHRAEQAKRAK